MRPTTRVCQIRHDQEELDPTELNTGRSWSLLISHSARVNLAEWQLGRG